MSESSLEDVLGKLLDYTTSWRCVLCS